MQVFIKNIVILLFVLTSCTTPLRKIASDDLVVGENFNPIIQIHQSSEIINQESLPSLEQFVEQTNTKYLNRSFDSNETRSIEIVFKEIQLSDGVKFAIDAQVKENGIHQIVIYKNTNIPEVDDYSNRAVINFIQKINDNKYFPNTYSFFEAMFNAKFGDDLAIKNLKNLQQISIDSEVQLGASEEKEILAKEIEGLDLRIAQVKKDRKKMEASRKEVMAALDKASDDGQLRTLLQKNDRQGVAGLLEKYLPREQMTPMENKFWDQILYKIKNPVPLKDRVLMFRGTLGDRLYPAIENGKEIAYEQAVKEGKLAAMSTVITRNQGTWNRRLRSLQTIYDKKLTQNPNNISSPFTQSARLTTWMKQHSIEAQGSPFLSFTSDFDVGMRFGFSIGKSDAADKEGAKSLGAFLIDPEILVFNQMTSFKGEMEYLHSLISFPDEMVSYVDESVNGTLTTQEVRKLIYDGFHARIVAQYGEEASSEIIEKIENTSKLFNDQATAYLHPQFKTVKKEVLVPGEPSFMKKMWGKITGKNVENFKTEVTYIKEIDQMPKLNSCLYIIKSFYK